MLTAKRKSRFCVMVWTLLQFLVWFVLLSWLDQVDAELRVTADRSRVRINVGLQVSLVWRYSTGSTDYESILWGKADDRGINFRDILFTKTPDQANPKLTNSIPAAFRGRVKITNRATLVISRVKPSDEGFYLCEIRYLFEVFKKLIHLTVIDPARITSHPPASVQYKEGQTKKLVCKASGKPKPSVKWLKNGKVIKKQNRKVEVLFSPVTDADMASYKCLAENIGGKDERVSNVSVLFKPKDTTFKTDANANTVSIGSTVNFICTARGYPKPEYKFFLKSGVRPELRLDYRQAERSGKIINLGIVDSSSHGTYVCIPHNKFGEGPRQEVILYVKYPPVIIRAPRDTTIEEGGFMAVQCKADGYPIPIITWMKLTGNEVLNGGDSFSISSVDRADHGMYRCIARNIFGELAIGDFTINVLYPPIINTTVSSQQVSAWNGHSATLLCIADGNPPPKYKWTNASGVISVSEVGGTLTITPRDDDAFGHYTCEVSNSRGRDSHTVTLIKVGQPGPITLEVTVTTQNSLRVQWTVSDTGQSKIIKFTLQYKPTNTKGAFTTIKLAKSRSEYELKGLDPFTEYVVMLTATNEHFTSDPVEVRKRTQGAAPTAPRDVIAFPLNNSAIIVKWQEPERKNSKKLGGYTVLYCRVKECRSLQMPRVSVAHNITSTVVGRLQAFSNYSVMVKAYNMMGHKESKPVIVTTAMAAPSVPEDLQVNSSAFKVRLIWKRPRMLNGKVTMFRVRLQWRLVTSRKYTDEKLLIPAIVTARVRRKRRRARTARLARQARSLEYTVLSLGPLREVAISGLQPYSMYTITVCEGTGGINNGVLWGLYSDGRSVEMPEGPPSKPRNIGVLSKGLHSLDVSWERPAFPNGKIRQYTIMYSNTTGLNYTVNIRKRLADLSLKYQLKGLRAYTPYNIRVRAYTLYAGPFSDPVSASTGPERFNNSMNNTAGFNLANFTTTVSMTTTPTTLTTMLRHEITTQPRSGATLEDDCPSEGCSNTSAQGGEVDAGSLFGGVFAGIILFAFVIIIAVLLIRNRRRKRDSAELKGNRYGVANSNDSGIGEKESLDNVPGVKYIQGGRRGSEEVVGPGGFVTVKPIPVNKLAEYCEINHADNNKAFKEEFLCIRLPVNFTWENSQKNENKPKNRYQNIVAYDHTRVPISELQGVASSDYINANFIDKYAVGKKGYSSRSKFIATQGPVANTFDDFWRMVWEHGASVIVMVTNNIERGKVKCLKYWPTTNQEEYGPVVVTPLEEEELSHHVIRKFCLEMPSSNVEHPAREVTQYHYTAWPDHGVPLHATSLLTFIRRVRNSIHEDSGPIVVHCSAGVGRTGTFIVLDAMMDQMVHEGVVDVFGFVSHIRLQRNMMVQTEAQYMFIHDALMEAAKCGNTEFKVQELHDRMNVLQSRDPDTGETYLVKEFKNLDIGDCEVETFDNASMPENKAKNRYAILPYDRTRVKLWPYPAVLGSDYINASFIDSYQQREAFLATQSPLETTISEMWRMIWEYESYTIVMINQESENIEGQSYLPDKEELVVYGLLMLEVESEEKKNGYSKRQVKMTNTKSGEVRNIFHFQYYDWAEDTVPRDGTLVIDMLKHIARAQQQTGNGPIAVHCSDGSGRTGTFCAISIALERVKLDGTIDMFQTVRNLRTQRPIMVQTPEQYQYCYEVVRQFVDAYSDYANFK